MSSKLDFDEKRWVIQIRQILEDDLDEDNEVPVCIFNVPKSLMATNPESYVPQQVAIGPYHYRCLELFEMERYKLSAAKRVRKKLQNLEFHDLVDHLMELEPRIRSCYHRFLDFDGETLSWMMAIDASFLLEFFQVYSNGEGRALSRSVSLRFLHLVDSSGRKLAHNAILRDIVMLENQIPLLVLRKLLELQFSSVESADDLLISILLGLNKELSPFKMLENLPKIKPSTCFHLLDFLYQMNVPPLEESSETLEIVVDREESDERRENFLKQFAYCSLNLVSNLKRLAVRFIERVLISGLAKIIFRIPWTILSNLPVFAVFKQPVEYLIFSQDREERRQESSDPKMNNLSRPPLVEEIAIPSVTDLSIAGVHFSPTNYGISTISFDVKQATFFLPAMSLDDKSEAVLRNMVAYEASNGSGPLIFSRFCELINGIIDTENDVKLLREKGIVFNHLKSDGELARMWNGMNKSIRLTRAPHLDKVIEDVNRYYNSRWKIKAANFVETYVFSSWPSLALLAAIFLLLLTLLQTFCSVYYRGRISSSQ